MFVDKKRGTMQVVLLFLLVIGIVYSSLLFGQKQYITPVSTPSLTPYTPNKETAIVIEVIDGDTMRLSTGQTVRLIGIDTPELHHPKKPVECFAQEAQKKLQELILGRKVRLEKDVSETDRFGRLLRYVYIEDDFVNEILVKDGFAKAVTFPPDVKYSQRFRQAQEEAKLRNRGLWDTCSLNIP